MYHISLCSDETNYMGLFAVINSIKQNTLQINKIMFHILIYDNSEKFNDIMKTLFFDNIKYEVVELIKYPKIISFLEKHMVGYGNRFKYLCNIMNFARFYIPTIFDKVDFGLYMDTDMIVLADIIGIFYEAELNNDFIIGFPKKLRKNEVFIDGILSKKYVDGFNAGIYLLNFDYCRKYNILSQCEELMKQNKEQKMFELGTQPIINIVFHEKCTLLDKRWNFTGLGSKTCDVDKIGKQFVLHWTGIKKPWLEDGLNKDYWNKYKLSIS